jgi:hypothetical protein
MRRDEQLVQRKNAIRSVDRESAFVTALAMARFHTRFTGERDWSTPSKNRLLWWWFTIKRSRNCNWRERGRLSFSSPRPNTVYVVIARTICTIPRFPTEAINSFAWFYAWFVDDR